LPTLLLSLHDAHPISLRRWRDETVVDRGADDFRPAGKSRAARRAGRKTFRRAHVRVRNLDDRARALGPQRAAPGSSSGGVPPARSEEHTSELQSLMQL